MKLHINRKKLRFGSIAIALTAFIIAAVVLLNVFFLSLANNFRWYIDMTAESMFTLSDECRELLIGSVKGEGGINDQRAEYNRENSLTLEDEDYKPEVDVTIFFCDDPDNLSESTYMKYVYTTALELESACDFINIDYLNWEYNPSSVQKYQTTGQNINSQSIIIESGTEYRTYSLVDMFVTEPDDSSSIWAYNGEKKLAGGILAVSSVDQPVAYITTGHSEAFYDTALIELLVDAGYKIQVEGQTDKDGNVLVPTLDDKNVNPLENEDVRLVVIYNPRSDFLTTGTANELDRLNRFLEKNNSMMVFMDPYSPVLPDFEEWLAVQWGVVFDRYKSGNETFSYMIKDDSTSLDNAGYTIRANYETTGGLGHAIYSQMLENGKAPSVFFENSMSISYSSNFNMTKLTDDEDSSKDYDYGGYYVDGVNKEIYNVFTAPDSAVAVANGTTVAQGGSSNPSNGAVTYIFTDSDKKVYTLSGDKIVDSDGNELPFNANGNYVTPTGTELKVENNTIKAVGNVGSVDIVIKQIIEQNASGDLKYSLNATGTGILDNNGVELTADENGQYKTAAGSILKIVDIGGQKSIKVVSGAASSADPFRLMTITQRATSVPETDYVSAIQTAYVLACGSTKFATRSYLESAVYGNRDVLLSATVLMGRDSVPVGIDFKPFASFTISDITDAEANRYTWILTVFPPVIVLAVGVVVLVRRKYS